MTQDSKVSVITPLELVIRRAAYQAAALMFEQTNTMNNGWTVEQQCNETGEDVSDLMHDTWEEIEIVVAHQGMAEAPKFYTQEEVESLMRRAARKASEITWDSTGEGHNGEYTSEGNTSEEKFTEAYKARVERHALAAVHFVLNEEPANG